MSQIFHRSANIWSKVSILAVVVLLGFLGWVVVAVSWSGYVTGQGVTFVEQPVQFSHAHHVGGDGHRLPLLPHDRRRVGVREYSADQDLHELPLADLDQCADARAGARQLPRQPVRSSGRGCTTCPISSTSTTAST